MSCAVHQRSLWRRYDPTVYATIWGFDRQPHKIWELLSEFLEETTPRPNAGHLALAELQQLGIVSALVTQNVGVCCIYGPVCGLLTKAESACVRSHRQPSPGRWRGRRD